MSNLLMEEDWLWPPCWFGDKAWFDFLWYDEANVNEEDKDGWRLLHHAVYGGNLEIISHLLEKGAELITYPWNILSVAAYLR